MKEVKKLKFNELALSDDMQRAITDMGFIEASPIQSQTIPHLLERKDVIGQAQTGTGKTAAFGIPLLELIQPEDKFVSSLVMCPTRELAQQVAMELKRLARYKKHIHILPVYGGASMQEQIQHLRRGMNVIVGTPGRIMDHLDRKTLSFEKVKMAVLDEADTMLDMGFREDIESILKNMPPERQTVLFSATMPKPILDIAKRFQKHPVHVKVTTDNLTAASIEQVYFEIASASRTKIMTTLMDIHSLKLVLVFCNTKRKVDEVVGQLREQGQKADAIHGDLSQAQRNAVLSSFKSGRINILVASDVAARGIDVSNVDAVFNYDIPVDAEYYVHRIGRTGRAGKTGKAFSFVTGRNDSYRLRDIERYAKTRIERANVPTEKEILEIHNVKLLTQLKKIVADGHLEKFETMVNDYCKEGFTPEQLAAALLKLSLKGVDKVHTPQPRRPDADHGRNNSHERSGYSNRPAFTPRERHDGQRSHSGESNHRRSDNRFSTERKPEGERNRSGFRKRRHHGG